MVVNNVGLEAVVIGSSAGACDTLSRLLAKLPAVFPVPILIVVHIGSRRDGKLIPLLQSQCALTLLEAEDKMDIKRNTVYFAPPNYHLLVEQDKTLSLSMDPPKMFSRPSIDVLFESGADCYGSGIVGMVLSGENSDGTNGLKSIIAGGGIGIVETPEQALHETMPRSAQQANPSARVMDIDSIAAYLCELAAA